jgi:hypothetical protein
MAVKPSSPFVPSRESDRFDAAWQIVSAEYRRDVSLPQNIVPINSYRVASV